MSLRSALLVLLFGLVAAVPAAQAKDAACVIDQKDLCDAALNAKLDTIAPGAADLVLIGLGLVAVAAVLTFILWLVFHAKPQRLLRMTTGEKLKEIEPGGAARFKLELENHNQKLPVDVFLERGSFPTGWTHDVMAATVLPSGFRVVQPMAETSSVSLSSVARGSHTAIVTMSVSAPKEVQNEETLDLELRAVPVFRGKLRKGKSKKVRLTVLVTPHVPVVQIARVSHSPDHIRVGSPVMTRALLVNKGEKDAVDIAVSFMLNGQEIDKKIVPAIGVQAEASVEFNWTPQSGENKIRVALGS